MHLKIILLLLLLFSFYIDKKYKKENYLVVFLFYNFFVIGFMYVTGVLSSGYHLIDDHEVYTHGRTLSEMGLLPALKKILSDDMTGVKNSRFRFLYILIRVLQIYILKDNFFMWHLLYAVLTSINMFLAYSFARKQRCPIWLAYAFSIVIFIGGGQSAVIWRLGPQENLGLLILFLLLLYITKQPSKRKMAILIILTILLGGIKESFLMLLPVLPIMMGNWDVKNQNKSVTLSNLLEAIGKNRIYLIADWLIFIIDIAIIIFGVGTNNNGYAGLDTTAGLRSMVRNMYYVLIGPLKMYLLLSVLGIIILGVCAVRHYKEGITTKKEIVNKFIIYVFLYGYIFLTQIVLHLKSGMFERYLLPSVVAFAIMWMIDAYAEAMDFCKPIVYKAFLAGTVIVLVLTGEDQREALRYAKDGADVTAALSKVAELCDDGTKVIVGIGYEADNSTSIYLQEHFGANNVYNVFLTRIEDGKVQDCYNPNSLDIQPIAVEDADIYIDYKGSLDEVFDEYGINKLLDTKYEYGNYRIAINEDRIPTKKMLIVGDSIGNGTGVSDYDRKWYKFLPSFMEEQYNVKLHITNVSMGGNTSFAGYSRVMDMEEDDFDYVIICYGQNDSPEDFSLYYESILRAVYWKYPKSKVITILESSQREYTEKMKTISSLSDHYGARVVDTIAAFNNSGMPYDMLTDDGTHPNEKGQELYYETVKDAMVQIAADEDSLDYKEITPVNAEVEEFQNYKFYRVDEFEKISEVELKLELEKTTAMFGICYTPVMGENQIQIYAEDVLILDKEFEWEHSFVQDYIELASKNKETFSELRIVFGSEEQREKFQGVILTAFSE